MALPQWASSRVSPCLASLLLFQQCACACSSPPCASLCYCSPLLRRSVHFFDHLGSQERRKLRPDQISSMVVASFQVGWFIIIRTLMGAAVA